MTLISTTAERHEYRTGNPLEDPMGDACPAAHQCVGIMFGFLAGYSTLVLVGPGIFVLLATSGGISFGVLGSRIPNPFAIDLSTWVKFWFLCYIFCLPFYSLLHFKLIGVIILSLLVSTFASQVQFWIDIFSRAYKGKVKAIEETQQSMRV